VVVRPEDLEVELDVFDLEEGLHHHRNVERASTSKKGGSRESSPPPPTQQCVVWIGSLIRHVRVRLSRPG
jgi:hypothetical protein